MKCPRCNSRGQVPAYIETRSSGGSLRMVNCGQCDGTGQISREQAAWIEQGEMMRSVRLAGGRTLRVEADRLGVPVIRLSMAERGMIDPNTLTDPTPQQENPHE